ncbi:MAG: NirD/YgiW/YdeI family stress tolerance protein [Desulfovibrionaceae bacterium]|nr:NirD/YgiW/YdeI family stress tolerance protein [Desulfovibrionaceae bacterium]
MKLLPALLLACALAFPAAAQADFVPAGQPAAPATQPSAQGGGFQGPGNHGHSGGFHGPSTHHRVTSAAQASQAWDDTPCELTGNIINHAWKDKYTFRDETGTILVEIHGKQFRGQSVTPESRVRIVGEVDHDDGRVIVDVDYLEVLR